MIKEAEAGEIQSGGWKSGGPCTIVQKLARTKAPNGCAQAVCVRLGKLWGSKAGKIALRDEES